MVVLGRLALLRVLAVVLCLAAAGWSVRAQRRDDFPTARLVRAPRLALPIEVDSSVPVLWDLVDGIPTLFAFASWGGVPTLLAGPRLDATRRVDTIALGPHPGWGVWFESVLADDSGTWFGYYHNEIAGEVCGRPVQSILRIGAARSRDRGLTWENLGTILEGPAGGVVCDTNNRFVLGGVGDLSAILDADRLYLYLFVSQYSSDRGAQGVAVTRLAWSDRDEPQGRLDVWRDGAWLPASRTYDAEGMPLGWSYPVGTPLVPVTKPWHDGNPAADAFWGPSVHWNTYLERYVMFLNRAENESFDNEGLYVSYAGTLRDPRAWSTPRKVMDGGGWYPQVVGLEPNIGTDKVAGQRARFLVTGRSDWMIEFER
jgi:hypothetical protein